MPCRDYESDEFLSPPNELQKSVDMLKSSLDERTAQLCNILRTFEKEYPIPLELYFRDNPDMVDWWKVHKIEDEKAMLQSAISKLTKQEQELYTKYIREGS